MMTLPVIGLVVSALSVVALTLLFNFEKKRRNRIGAPVRNALDRALMWAGDAVAAFFERATRGLSRQTVYFFFHAILVLLLRFLQRSEEKVDSMLRLNRTRARKARGASAARNKLDAIAEHKEQVALSEDERRRRREESLNG